MRSTRVAARAGVPADPEQARLRPTGARGLRRRAAAGRNHGALAYVWRQRRGNLRSDRRPPAASSPASAGRFRAPGDVGTPPSTAGRCRLSEDGEVLVRSPDLFEGYWRNEEATRDGHRRRRLAADRRRRRMARRRAAADRSRPRFHRHRRAARPSRRRSSRTRCAPAPMSPKRSCSVTAANILQRSSRSTSTRSPIGRAATMSPTPASPASPQNPAVERLIRDEIDKANARARARRADQSRSASCPRRSIPKRKASR